MVVLDPNLDDAGVEAVTARVNNLVTQRGGTVAGVEPWGRRRLAYPIARYRDGIYVLSRLSLPPNATAEIERALKLTESVIRHLLVRAIEPSPASPSRA
jgi:small subunit ribosomal protein S6